MFVKSLIKLETAISNVINEEPSIKVIEEKQEP